MERMPVEVSGRSLAIHLIVLVVLLAINAFVSAGEIAYISLSQQNMNDLALEDNKRAKKLLKLISESDQVISSLQSAITLTEVLASVYFSVFVYDLIQPLDFLPGPLDWLLPFALVVFLLTLIFIVLGEKIPKRLAAQDPDQAALRLVHGVAFIDSLMTPFVWLVSVFTQGLQAVLPYDFDYNTERFTRDEMQSILVESHNEGSIDMEEFTMLEGVLSLNDKIARAVMVPRTDIQMVNVDDDPKENIDEILESPFSRIPIYQGDRDNIVGILHTKSLLKSIRVKDEREIDLLALSYDPLFVPATMYIDDLLIDFKRQQQHMAILMDEYGGVEGIVTMEDLLEEIVGEIDDENDVQRLTDIRQVDKNNAFINAGIDIEDFNDYYKVNIPSDDIETLAGAITREIGFVPSSTDRFKLRVGNYVIQTLRAESGRIYTVKVTADPAQSIITDYVITENGDSQES